MSQVIIGAFILFLAFAMQAEAEVVCGTNSSGIPSCHGCVDTGTSRYCY